MALGGPRQVAGEMVRGGSLIFRHPRMVLSSGAGQRSWSALPLSLDRTPLSAHFACILGFIQPYSQEEELGSVFCMQAEEKKHEGHGPDCDP